VCEENKQVHRNSPVFPHAMVLRLTPRSPRRRVRFATVVRGLRFCLPGWAGFASANLTPATGARTTRLHRTQKRRSARRPPLTRFISPCDCLSRLTLSRPPHPIPNVRDDRDTPLQGRRDGFGYGADLGQARSEIFLILGLDTISENQK
jgi:hypothetical protein